MVAVKRIFDERVTEIKEYFDFVADFTQNHHDNNINKILKSNMILMLYNLVESSISNAIEEIHNSIHSNETSFNILTIELKEVLIKQLSSKNPKKFVQGITDLAMDIIKKGFDKNKICNGNIDSKKIKELSVVYGFSSSTTYEQTKNGQILEDIKGKRNDLAHGVFSFVEIGKEYTIQDLEKMKKEAISYLTEIIANIDHYLIHQEYRYIAV